MKAGKFEIEETHLKRMRIPKVHWKASLDQIPEACRHRDIITRYCKNIKENIVLPVGLLLFGEYSSGKSAIGSICLKEAARCGIIGYWLSAGDLPRFQIEKELFDEELTHYERSRSAPIMVVDEYFMRSEMKYTEDAVDALVRSRIDEQLCTIITTNHTPGQIESARPALAAALLEATYPVKIGGYNFRKIQGKEMTI